MTRFGRRMRHPQPTTPSSSPLGRLASALFLVACTAWAGAHVPYFPPGDAPVDVRDPTLSKAYYLRSTPNAPHLFVVDPVERRIPVQLLVLDDPLGRSLAFEVRVTCGAEAETLGPVDVPFYEPFSQIDHRIVAAGGLGPSTTPCTVTVVQTEGPVGPYTFSIGDEERFGPSAMASMLTLRRDLRRWQDPAGP